MPYPYLVSKDITYNLYVALLLRIGINIAAIEGFDLRTKPDSSLL
jgi:hypothetical protein